MNRANLTTENSTMPLTTILRDGLVTVPAELQRALQLKEGDALEAEVRDGELILRPASTHSREEAWDRVMAIVDRPKWRGPGPEPSDDELLEEAVEEIHALRVEHDQSRPR